MRDGRGQEPLAPSSPNSWPIGPFLVVGSLELKWTPFFAFVFGHRKVVFLVLVYFGPLLPS